MPSYVVSERKNFVLKLKGTRDKIPNKILFPNIRVLWQMNLVKWRHID